MATTFVPGQYVRLHHLVQRAAASPSSSSGTSNEWYVAVDGLRNDLVDLGRVRGVDEVERKEIESGKITLAGKTHTINADFSSLTLLLASNLSVSPRYCASLLQSALAARSRYPSRSPIEIAFILYQRERWALTEAWKQLVAGAVTLPQDQSVPARKLGLKYSQAVQGLLNLVVSEPGKRPASSSSSTTQGVTLPQRLLAELDALKGQAVSVDNALRNPPTNSSLRLPDEVQLERLSAIHSERRAWAHVLYLLCVSSFMRGDDIIAIARWLSKIREDENGGSQEDLLPYIFTALLAALETSTKTSLEGAVGAGLPDLLDDHAALSQLNALINQSTWATPSLQAVAQLQWSLLLVEVIKQEPGLGSELRVTEESVSRAVLKAIQENDAFVYIVVRLLRWRQRALDAVEGLEEEDNGTLPSGDRNASLAQTDDDDVDVEFQPYLLSSLHSVLLGVTRTFLSLIRKSQRQEEDAAFSTGGRQGAQVERRYDLEALLDSIALVVRGDASKALEFWLSPEGRRSRFITWAIGLREEGHQRALLDLLCAMASGGSEAAWQGHSLLASNGDDGALISWSRLWDWIAYYADILQTQQGPGAGMPPTEATLLRSFLRLLRAVAAGSFAARESLLALNLRSNSSASALQATANPFGPQSSQSSLSASGSSGSNVLQRLFALYVCPAPIELKAALLDAMAAFARDGPPGSGSTTRTAAVRRELWHLIEASGILSGGSRSSRAALGVRSSYQQLASAGVRFELDHVEAPSGSYPATISFIQLLTALVVPNTNNRASGDVGALVADLPSSQTAANQGPQHQLEYPTSDGLERYISFAVDAALLPSLSGSAPREFVNVNEKWRLISASLGFLERCLSAFDLGALERLDGGRRGADDRQTLLHLLMHPGFGVFKRITSASSKLLKEVLGIVSTPSNGILGVANNAAGFEVVDSRNAARSVPFLSIAVRHALSIVLKAVRGQGLFLQVLLPTVNALNETPDDRASILPGLDLSTRIGQSANYTPIDAKLLQEYEGVVQLALYANSTHDDLALLSVRLLNEIASSTAFAESDRFADTVGGTGGRRRMNRLVGLLEMTDEAGRVREGIVRRLDALAEGNDQETVVTGLLDKAAGGEVEDDTGLLGLAPQVNGGNAAVCEAVFELLLAHTSTTGGSRMTPNIAHLLLGFDLRAVDAGAGEQAIPVPGPDSPRGAFQSILDLLRPATSEVDGEDASTNSATGLPSTLLHSHPALAEKALQLLLNLATHPFTSSSVLRYLRNQEDFWTTQLCHNFSGYSAPVERETLGEVEASSTSTIPIARGNVVFADGSSVHTSVDAVVASLQCRQHLLTGTALELHGLVAAGMQAQASKLVAALYGSQVVSASLDSKDEDDIDTYSEDGDRLPRILGLLQSFDFEWHDERDGLAAHLSMLRDLDISQASLSSPSVREYDIGKTIALLAFARRELERLGELSEPRRRAIFDSEAAIVLQHVSARNAHRAIMRSRRSAVGSWRNVQDIVLSHAGTVFRPEAHPMVVFESLTALLPRLDGMAPNEDPILADLAAGAVLSLLTSLRRHRSRKGTVAGSQQPLTDTMPLEHLLATLSSLIGALCRPGTSISARGNLYSALINFIQLTRSPASERENTMQEDSTYLLGESQVGGAPSVISGLSTTADAGSLNSPLESRCRTLLAQHAERLVPVIARDALDAPDVWRTVAFTLLDKLASLEIGRSSSRSMPLLLDILSRGGFMRSFVARLRDMDLALQDVLRPDPASLNALYVYEASMAFFSRLAISREGAERLLDAKVFDALIQADYLAAKPEQDQDFVDLESFLPAATERYGALLLPALRVSVSIVTTVQLRASSNAHAVPHAAARQALSLLSAHRDALVSVLRSANQEMVSVGIIEQCQLIVGLMLQVLPILEDDALSAPKPLAAYHAAILALAAGYMHSASWSSRVVPFSEGEREDETRPAFDLHDVGAKRHNAAAGTRNLAAGAEDARSTVFGVSASDAVSQLLLSISSYLESASELRGARDDGQTAVRPCLTSSLAVPQPYSVTGSRAVSVLPGASDDMRKSQRDGGVSRLASVPSLGMALASMDEQVAELEEHMATADRVQSMLENSENVRLEEWDVIAQQVLSTEQDSLVEAAISQRRAIAIKALRDYLTKLRGKSTQHLDIVDLLLVLIQRHFAFYLDLRNGSGTTARGSVPTGVDDAFSSAWRSAQGSQGNSKKVTGSLGPIDTRSLLDDGGEMVQMVLERLGRVLLSMTAAATTNVRHVGGASKDAPATHSGPGGIRERAAFLELVGRRLQTLLIAGEAEP